MQEVYRNIYKTARKAAGLTQERWAEQLAIRRADIKRNLPGIRPGWGCVCRGAAGGYMSYHSAFSLKNAHLG